MTELPFSISQMGWSAVDDEAETIQRAKHDPKAFATLYRLHYAPIAGYVYRRLGDAHLTEDLVAEVFIAAFRSIRRYRHRGLPFRSWLYRIATNVVNRWLRRNRHRTMESLGSEQTMAMRSDDQPPTGHIESERARRALWMISPKYQAVISLHYLESMSVEEVSVALGIRVGTVKSRLSRGRDALRKELSTREMVK